MLTLVNFFRTLIVVAICLVLSACTQSTSNSSSYNGKIGSKSATEKSRQAKIRASRKRAKTIKQAERKKFLKKRFSNARTSSSKARNRNSRYNKRRSYRNKKTRVSSRSAGRKYSKRKKSRRRVASKRNSKSRTKRLKKSSYAYVGGRSKGIRRNSKPWRCVPGRLKKVLRQVSKKFGRVTINSTHRSKRHNRRVGGKRRSFHLRCQAVDFRVHGRTRGLTRWLANHPLVGGYNRYPSGYYHIDTGPKRTW